MLQTIICLGRSRGRLLSLAMIAAAIALPSSAQAAVCSVSPQSVSFGSYDPLNRGPLEGVGNISVNCDSPISFTISLSSGQGAYSARQMASGADRMTYNLYRDAARLLVWGDGSGSTSTVSTIATSANFTVYGRIPANQNVRAGTYSDMIMVTVTY